MNGKRISGQVYAYVHGDAGVKGHVWWYGDFDLRLASISAATVLSGKGPNPTYFNGAVAFSFSILDGFIEGSASMNVAIGNDCPISYN